MKIRNGFVSNSSTSSFIIKSYKDENKKLNLKNFLTDIFNDSDINQQYRDINIMKRNVKNIDENANFVHIDADCDDTKIGYTDNEIYIEASYHFDWHTFFENRYNWCNDYKDGDNAYNKKYDDNTDTYILKDKIYLPKFGLLFDDYEYGTCKKCDRYHKMLIFNNKQYCEYCDSKILNGLKRLLKIKKILK